jgi:cytidylate kinase
VITIDGPAGAGKSSVASGLAERFAFDFLDTGAMYRAVTLFCLRGGVDLEDPQQIEQAAERAEVHFAGQRVLLNGEDVSQLIRTPEIDKAIRTVADHPAVRTRLKNRQRAFARGRQIVTEGRDQGTDVFPDAACKFFLNASPETRARRRHAEMVRRGSTKSYDQVLAELSRRDREDAARPMGQLRKARDAQEVETDDLELSAVIDRLAALVNERMAQPR